jgi:hypothetical protein
MTVIAWDGQILAADKLACFGATKGTVTKIFRFKNELLAITGCLSAGMETMQWYTEGAVKADYPPSNRMQNEGASLIVIKQDKSVWKYEKSPVPFRVEGSFCAFGCGDESALIAMECGANALRAVELVIKYNSGCGNGIDVLEFE